jgi:hypothetical protein
MKYLKILNIILLLIASYALINITQLFFNYEQTLHENPSSYMADIPDDELNPRELIYKKTSFVTYELWISNRDIYKWMFILTILYIALVIVFMVFLSSRI